MRVTEVDVPRKRIGLTMRKEGGAESGARESRNEPRGSNQPRPGQGRAPQPKPQAPSQGAFGAALAEAMKRK